MVKKKKLIKAIKSFEERIKEHQRKILEYQGKKDYLEGYWKGEIERFEKRKEKRLNKKR